MDILLLDALAPEVVTWLEIRHRVSVRPELALDLLALRKEAYKTRGIIFPPKTVVTRELLGFLPKLKVIGRLMGGMDNTDLDFCKKQGIKVVYAGNAHVISNAEYLLGSLLLLYRRGLAMGLSPGERPAAGRAGRELYGSTVGILGLSPVAHTLASTLTALGVRLIGYDPAVHHSSPLWDKLRIKPVALPELMSRSDAVSLQTLDAERFNGFFNDKVLAHCKPGQMWVGISRRSMFDEAALAAALTDGRIEACMLDGDDAGVLDDASPLKGLKNLHLTPSLGSHTREAYVRSCWYVAHRLSVAISIQACAHDALPSAPMPIQSDLAALLPSEAELKEAFR